MNEIILEKAIKYQRDGVVGLDLAGPIERTDQSQRFKPEDIADLAYRAKEAGLGLTVHTGEATSTEEMWEVVNHLKPDRIGHGIACIHDPAMMDYLRDHRIVLELCPTSNIHTKRFDSWEQLRDCYQKIRDHGITFTINTDGPEMQKTSLRTEFERLLSHQVFSQQDLLKANQTAHEASFVK